MKILVAPDSFKECLSAREVAKYITQGIQEVYPKAEVTQLPVSDGGEGLLTALIQENKGKLITTTVHDPLLRKIEATYGILHHQHTAVIEMAEASGLELLQEEEKNPLITSTYGTGELIKHALDQGCRNFIIGIGGSATNDGGVGMAQALGAKFLDTHQQEISAGGGQLHHLKTIDTSQLDPRILASKITVACDVSNPFTGKNGASMVYGAQKGGSPSDLISLDQNLQHLSNCIQQQLGINIDKIPGAGAAGGTGGGLIAFLNADLQNGMELIINALQLETKIKEVDLIFTGEGKIDHQTTQGKTIAGLAKVAQRYEKPLIALAGKVTFPLQELHEIGVTAIYAIADQPMTLTEAMERAPELLHHQTTQIMRTLKIGEPL